MNPATAVFSWLGRHQKALVLAGLTLVAYLAAINREQSLPWAIAALLSATLIAGLLWPRWLLSQITITRNGPERAEEGETVHFTVELQNHGWLPRFMIEVVDRLPFAGFATGKALPQDQILGVVAYLPGRSKRRFKVPVLCEKRGFYHLGPVGMSSSFPLGLAEVRSRKNGGLQNLTVYPDLFPLCELPLVGTPSQIHRGGLLLPEGAGAAEFSGLREYRRGDNPRHIHWPSTARNNTLLVKEFEPLASACLTVAIDMAARSNLGMGREATFEYAVRIAASIARFACDQAMPIRMVGEGQRPLAIGSGLGEAHHRDILDTLAIIDADGHTPYATVLRDFSAYCRRGETVVIFLSLADDEHDATLAAVAMLHTKGAHVLAVAFDRGSFRARGTVAPEERAWVSLLDLGVSVLPVRCGDDLMKLFNP